MLSEDDSEFIRQLEQGRKFYTGSRSDYEEQLCALRREKSELEKKMTVLVDSLADVGDGIARNQVTKRIEQLGKEIGTTDSRINELEGLTSQQELTDMEFDIFRQLLTDFRNGIDGMSVEQKRTAIRTLVRKVVWDGANAHVILFGVQDDDIDLPFEIGGSEEADADSKTSLCENGK